MKIAITGGGTGGHLFPALRIAEKLRNENHDIYYFGHKKCIEFEETKKRNIPFFSVPSKNTMKKDIKFIVENVRGLLKTVLHFKRIKPEVVYSTGGFTTFPVVAAAILLKIPVILHEQNAVVGLVNRLFRKKAHTFIHAFPYDVKNDEKFLGNLCRYTEKIERKGTNIVFMGGSGGAKVINDLALKYAKDYSDKNVVLLSGRNYNEEEELSNLEVHRFVEDMTTIYKNTDVVVARAGSTTLSELSFLGIPSIIIPMPNSADNHQDKNADYYKWKEAIIKISQDEYVYDSLLNALNKMSNKEKNRLSNAFQGCYNVHAEEEIVNLILQAKNKTAY